MKYFSMFSGIGGFEAVFPDSWRCVGYSEVDKYAESIYRKHFPEHKGCGDATRIISSGLPDFDLLCGGAPCVSFSLAGKRAGLSDGRGALVFEFIRVLRDKRPRYFLFENVLGLLSHDAGKTFQELVRLFTEAGYLLQWQVLNSADFGVPQRRERIFIVGHLRGKPRPQIFPFGETANSHPKPGRKETSQCLTGRNTNARGTHIQYGPHQQDKLHDPNGIMSPLVATTHGATPDHAKIQVKSLLRHGRGWEAKADGTSHALKGAGGGHSKVHIQVLEKGLGQWERVYRTEGLAPTLAMSDGKGGGRSPKILHENKSKQITPHSTSVALRAEASHNYQTVEGVRRITPLEAERLQGFPDGWTALGLDEQGKQIEISDTQRYRCLGNAVTVNVVRAIARRF